MQTYSNLSVDSFSDYESQVFFEQTRFADLSADDQKDLGDGKLVISNSYHHFFTIITGSESTGLIDPNSVFVYGENTFHQGKTPQGENICLKRLRVSHKIIDTGTSIGSVITSNVVDADLLPFWFNTNIVLLQDQKELLKLPVRRAYNTAAPDVPIEEQGFKLDNYELIKSNNPIQIKLEHPKGVALEPGAGKSFLVGFDFIGGMTTPR